ncbi:DNA processing protein [Sphingobacterium allocomposti]|uniref:DNA processing protein n=1 Tax=Sphingobacterium allocomposti TaxID=415956 RepID=A0A5S5DRK8_9SPHI|nr:DNA-processing protein DprA [Sphingobacterium composti Yoo et al. 2007 non Ten et al. 2007]TYP98570.1 DNA processing protein [Sphingobacterium composti Yoo et al. 2007 non Ten et al. 2007]
MNKLQQIALTKIKGVGPKTARSLLEYCGSLEQIFNIDEVTLHHLPFLQKKSVDSLLSKECLSEAEEELAFIEKHKITALWITDDNYPHRLKQCEDAPLMLYFKGTADLQPQRAVSIVGTRNATPYGKRICEELVEDLRDMDIQVISGLAHGIDVHAHRLSIRHAIPTIGVLGHGLDMLYPAAHRDVAARMLEHGGLLTEYPSGTRPDRINFPARNRIIAGLSDVTIVVEAAHKGGALITAEIANSYNREVCAFPGGINQPYSAGCNYLIKTHRAHLIRHAEDLLYLMGWERPQPAGPVQLSLPLSKDHQRIYDFLQRREQAHVDEIAAHVSWQASKLAMTLLEMEMNGTLFSLPGKLYKIQ